MGGLVFGAGGGGLERGLEAARAVFQVGSPVLVGLDELESDDQVMVMTGVGAPGPQRQLAWPRDGLRALELACEAWEGHGAIVGTMTAHPGAFMPGTWLANALDPHLAVDRLQCQRTRPSDRGDGRHGTRGPHRHQRRAGRRRRGRGAPRARRDRGSRAGRRRLGHPAPRIGGDRWRPARIARAVSRRVSPRARSRGRRVGLHPPRRGDDRGRGRGRRGRDRRDREDARRPRARARAGAGREGRRCARTGTWGRSRSTAAHAL